MTSPRVMLLASYVCIAYLSRDDIASAWPCCNFTNSTHQGTSFNEMVSLRLLQPIHEKLFRMHAYVLNSHYRSCSCHHRVPSHGHRYCTSMSLGPHQFHLNFNIPKLFFKCHSINETSQIHYCFKHLYSIIYIGFNYIARMAIHICCGIESGCCLPRVVFGQLCFLPLQVKSLVFQALDLALYVSAKKSTIIPDIFSTVFASHVINPKSLSCNERNVPQHNPRCYVYHI